MKNRIPAYWWPALALGSPVLAPLLAARNRRFKNNRARAADHNETRITAANKLELPELDFLSLTVVSEWLAAEGFRSEAGVSYFLKTSHGTLLYDVGFGSEGNAFVHNAAQLGLKIEHIDAIAISHLHPDHMGGMAAQKRGEVKVPLELGPPTHTPCYVPDVTEADGFETVVVNGPRMLSAGIASTGPLAASLFFFGWTEEQALIARIKGKGLVVMTGCGHQGTKLLLRYVRRLSDEPIHAIVGGFHLPVTKSRLALKGVEAQTILGTGKPPWQRIDDKDITEVIDCFNQAAPKAVYFSAHDSCDYSIERIRNEVPADVFLLEAGETYTI